MGIGVFASKAVSGSIVGVISPAKPVASRWQWGKHDFGIMSI
jgi:hypothetical protein